VDISSRALVEAVLLGPTSDRRQLQDSPILGDVWVAFATTPSGAVDLLLTPNRGAPAGPVAVEIARGIDRLKLSQRGEHGADIAYLEGLVAARLHFQEVVQIIVPMTKWWHEEDGRKRISGLKPAALRRAIKAMLDWATAADEDARDRSLDAFGHLTAIERYVALAGLILAASARTPDAGIGPALKDLSTPGPIVKEFMAVFARILKGKQPNKLVYQVSLNRKAIPALSRSVPAVKGDAARTLFSVKCSDVGWAVLDSGIDGSHPAFLDDKGKSRIAGAFDFTNLRKIVSLDNLTPGSPGFAARVAELTEGRATEISAKEAAEFLISLAEDAESDRPVNWEMVRRFIEIDPTTAPVGGHGTHVAGIIGASKNAAARKKVDCADGMCPDIRLYDFRVLSRTLEETEFAIVSALQFVRYLNERHGHITVHGANLSLSIPHDVRNFACGRTPICEECNRVAAGGVVVVAAAGNLGYQRFETGDGLFEGYAALSITDPGNASEVITVGATHRYKPHMYGISFFSSRGPTGDGRLKPDLVAPGERIESCLPNREWAELDGTSMAAPHVSGAAAMLMARYDELIGNPQRIKQILCESATDLGRERTFQGHGMLDVLRAFQRI
jgi:hypothetical protein